MDTLMKLKFKIRQEWRGGCEVVELVLVTSPGDDHIIASQELRSIGTPANAEAERVARTLATRLANGLAVLMQDEKSCAPCRETLSQRAALLASRVTELEGWEFVDSSAADAVGSVGAG